MNCFLYKDGCKSILLLLILSITSHVSQSQEVRIKLVDCKLDSAILIDISESLEFQIDFFRAIFKDSSLSKFSARIFKNEKEYLRYSKHYAKYNASDALAFFDHDLNEMILHTEIKDFSRTFKHELNHAIYFSLCKNHPTWLSEGLAEFMEDIILWQGNYIMDQGYNITFGSAKEYILEGANVEKIINTNNFYNTQDTNKNYTMSWAIINYLFFTDVKLLSIIIENSCGPLSYLAVEKFYPGGESALHQDVKSYYLNYSPATTPE